MSFINYLLGLSVFLFVNYIVVESICYSDNDCPFKQVCDQWNCSQKKRLQEACISTDECKRIDSNAICALNSSFLMSCICSSGYVAIVGTCIRELPPVTCYRDSDCYNSFDRDYQCLAGNCLPNIVFPSFRPIVIPTYTYRPTYTRTYYYSFVFIPLCIIIFCIKLCVRAANSSQGVQRGTPVTAVTVQPNVQPYQASENPPSYSTLYQTPPSQPNTISGGFNNPNHVSYAIQ